MDDSCVKALQTTNKSGVHSFSHPLRSHQNPIRRHFGRNKEIFRNAGSAAIACPLQRASALIYYTSCKAYPIAVMPSMVSTDKLTLSGIIEG
eukprot:2578267-Pleurochrysis_carterae.AAC.2